MYLIFKDAIARTVLPRFLTGFVLIIFLYFLVGCSSTKIVHTFGSVDCGSFNLTAQYEIKSVFPAPVYKNVVLKMSGIFFDTEVDRLDVEGDDGRDRALAVKRKDIHTDLFVSLPHQNLDTSSSCRQWPIFVSPSRFFKSEFKEISSCLLTHPREVWAIEDDMYYYTKDIRLDATSYTMPRTLPSVSYASTQNLSRRYVCKKDLALDIDMSGRAQWKDPRLFGENQTRLAGELSLDGTTLYLIDDAGEYYAEPYREIETKNIQLINSQVRACKDESGKSITEQYKIVKVPFEQVVKHSVGGSCLGTTSERFEWMYPDSKNQ